jgi:hypothetical protein
MRIFQAAALAAAFATALAAAPAVAQFDGGTPMELAVRAYGECFYRQARAADQAGTAAEAAIAGAFAKCKSQRKRTLKETQSRLAATGAPGATAKSMAESMLTSADRSLADTARQEFAKKHEGAAPR